MDKASVPEGWHIVARRDLQSSAPGYVEVDGLGLHPKLAELLAKRFATGIYRHQATAVVASVGGENVCLTTSTASGKTLAFHLAALQVLLTEPDARILAIYPLKALGNQQCERWSEMLHDLDLSAAAVIDGSVPEGTRKNVLTQARVVVMTPDVLHAWLLSHLSDSTVARFLADLRLVVVDEIHSYTGVFGSNAAFLFRRLQHAQSLLNRGARFFAASATIRNPQEHLERLFGQSFTVIGEESDSSPRQAIEVLLLRPPRAADLLTETAQLIRHVLRSSDDRLVTFVESRKQTEQIAIIVNRPEKSTAQSDSDQDDDERSYQDAMHDEKLGCLPYRAGYEAHDRREIERRLHNGSLRGVVSTSALELGIDIPHLDLGILVGVPRSATSLKQRIGRVARQRPGAVWIINSGDVFDEVVFRHPDTALDRPPAEGALYLDNRRIQYIHALCLARADGEHDALNKSVDPSEFTSSVSWPAGFVELCLAERAGEIENELQTLRIEAGQDPNHVFPLRDVEMQFKAEERVANLRNPAGQLSFSQVMREAYPGAVYYYMTQPFRVINLSIPRHEIVLRRERKRYTTKPQTLPVNVQPDLVQGNVFRQLRHENTALIECSLWVREAVNGYKERRGNTEVAVRYPPGPDSRLFWRGNVFARSFVSTGVLLTADALNVDRPGAHGHVESVARWIFESLLMLAPFERQDLGWAVGRYRGSSTLVEQDARFIVVYDQTYGSLRLSGRLLDHDVCRRVFENACEIAKAQHETDELETDILEELARGVSMGAPVLSTGEGLGGHTEHLEDERMRVLLVGSRAYDSGNGNSVVEVTGIFLHPSTGLMYRYRPTEFDAPAGQIYATEVRRLVPVPGEAKHGFYVFDSGDVVPDPNGLT
jgi:DEAD/DEAH box helicase domain-containing protein